MSRFSPYTKRFVVPENHSLKRFCDEFECRGLGPMKLAKAQQSRIFEMNEELDDEVRERQRRFRIQREIELRKAGIKLRDIDTDTETDEDKIESHSFKKLVELNGIHTMDESPLSNEDKAELIENATSDQVRYLIRCILITNGEIRETPLENN